MVRRRRLPSPRPRPPRPRLPRPECADGPGRIAAALAGGRPPPLNRTFTRSLKWPKANAKEPRRPESRRRPARRNRRSEEHTSELQSLMRISYAVFCLKKKKTIMIQPTHTQQYLTRITHNNVVTNKTIHTTTRKHT